MALKVFKERHFTFVLIGSEVQGIVTRADLNKPPVRVYLFSLVSLLEMHLGFWVRAEYPNDSWQQELKEERLAAARLLLKERRRRRQDPTLLECLQFCDKRDLIIRKKEVRARLGLGGAKASKRLLERAEALRNGLAHSQQDLAHGSSWVQLISLIETLETIVDRSDREVEDRAAKCAAGYADELWTSV